MDQVPVRQLPRPELLRAASDRLVEHHEHELPPTQHVVLRQLRLVLLLPHHRQRQHDHRQHRRRADGRRPADRGAQDLHQGPGSGLPCLRALPAHAALQPPLDGHQPRRRRRRHHPHRVVDRGSPALETLGRLHAGVRRPEGRHRRLRERAGAEAHLPERPRPQRCTGHPGPCGDHPRRFATTTSWRPAWRLRPAAAIP